MTLQKSSDDHKYLIGAVVSGALAAIVIRYVASVGHPGFVHAVLALLAVAGFVSAYLLVAKGNFNAEMTGVAIIGTALVSGICFAVVGYLV
jgi:hypothetical protein